MTEKPNQNEQNQTPRAGTDDATSTILSSCRAAYPYRVRCALDGMYFETFEAQHAQVYAEQTGGRVYSWKTKGSSNWLDAGRGCCDVLGLLVLPAGLPEMIDMEDDAHGDDTKNEDSYPAIAGRRGKT